jgi:hypothetical protein
LGFLLKSGNPQVLNHLNGECLLLNCGIISYVVDACQNGVIFRRSAQRRIKSEIVQMLSLVVGKVRDEPSCEHIDFHSKVTIATAVWVISLHKEINVIPLRYFVAKFRIGSEYGLKIART